MLVNCFFFFLFLLHVNGIVKNLTETQKGDIKEKLKQMNLPKNLCGKIETVLGDGDKETKDFVFYKVGKVANVKTFRAYQIENEIKIFKYLAQEGFSHAPHYLDDFEIINLKEGKISCLITSYIESPVGNLLECLGSFEFRRLLFRKPKVLKRIFLKIAISLHNLHQAGIIHADLKPDNIMIGKNFEPIVIDFGLSLILKEIPSDPNDDMYKGITHFRYIAPENPYASPFLGTKYDWYMYGKSLIYCADILKWGKPNLVFARRYFLYELEKLYSDQNFADLVYNLTLPNYNERFDFEKN